MFSIRRTLEGSRKYSREFFESFVSDLTKARFDRIEVLLPANQVGAEAHVVSPGELLNRERNYASIVLRAINIRKKETLKVLFINRNSRAVFLDDTFPSGESQPPGLYFQSPDPGRTYSVFHFFHDYLKRPGTSGSIWLAAIVAGFVLFTEVVAALSMRTGVVAAQWRQSPFWDVLLVALSLLILYRYFATPRGLWVKPRREARLLQLANMALRGELKDNPLVSLVVSVLGTVIAALILKWLGLL